VINPWFENDCLFADIILPANTKFEEEDISADAFCGQFLQAEDCGVLAVDIVADLGRAKLVTVESVLVSIGPDTVGIIQGTITRAASSLGTPPRAGALPYFI
jgi:hypothetical protein